ncbi:hypothetical protein ACFQV2_15780 [Actinokineospora soli]|uniref:Uncharacterized protein n=1 Tax=Actinokineospora soli TaxID=1048753 RepID=A0ABW2TN14_9PSEU
MLCYSEDAPVLARADDVLESLIPALYGTGVERWRCRSPGWRPSSST